MAPQDRYPEPALSSCQILLGAIHLLSRCWVLGTRSSALARCQVLRSCQGPSTSLLGVTGYPDPPANQRTRAQVNVIMLCRGAKGLTHHGRRSILLARFFFHRFDFLLGLFSRCASSTATNKLDVIMPPVEDFPARHIGGFRCWYWFQQNICLQARGSMTFGLCSNR